MEVQYILDEGCKQMGLLLEEEKIQQLLIYKDILIQWNQKMNLTAIEDEKEIIIKHFLDSLTCKLTKHLKDKGTMIDVGTGAGFPGIPLKILMPNMHLTLLDSLNKRINFLKEVCNEINLTDVTFIHGRAEDVGQDKRYREGYDYAVARAVAPLNVLVELCLPFVKTGGFFICQKGRRLQEELPQAEKAIALLGGSVIEMKEVQLPFSDIYSQHFSN
jgi:16S rRNA (guanine527-N7)-methyltransferase